MEAAHRFEQRGEPIAVPRVEERGKSVERVGRDGLEFVGLHDVSSIRTGCPRFLRDQRNPTARLEDTPRGRVERRGILTGRASRLLLAGSEAAGECRGVFVLRTTARPDWAYADEHVRDVLIATAGVRRGHSGTRASNCFRAGQRAGCNARRRKT